MNFTCAVNRRRFLQTTSSAIVASALSGGRTSAQSSNDLRVLVYGGDYAKAAIDAYVKPFEAETGIKVIPIADEVTLTQLQLMVNSNSVSVDVIALNYPTATVSAAQGLLEEIDYSLHNKEELDGALEFAKAPYGVGQTAYAYVMVYNTETYPAEKPRPASWSEFWDVEKYPGVRTLVDGQYGSQGPWEEALLADGVAPDALYPMDIDRVFASLDKIKPHVRKWWSVGSEIQQMMHDKLAALYQAYDGRTNLLIDQGVPLEINWNQSKVTWDLWAIPKGGPKVQNAQRFVEFATRADRQAAFAKLFPSAPTNLRAYESIPEDLGRRFPTHPDNIANSIFINAKWYAEVGADGLSNTERLIQRWNDWILQ
ncbi:putative spermidine/putrescine transport system substrate-binding protein [Mesorhizobium albiziae]|uniref:Putative spermidine/putrescine transport system substrate-binding protein n=1 Tax=Neomesorhizobium albiziae TaxID=335020 RepID=A0A1I4FTJ7_9HYPH|nr:ABC transporter substrate-binding protein [Mesorhizobium albiziae]GLS32577.1 ABC transporter substrate-binding protein [Mesorhizobium albiziae]SFL21178.1 putative spermidine/putrescine transport system substrate-binding protein [Mesorhizobium albiziae]